MFIENQMPRLIWRRYFVELLLAVLIFKANTITPLYSPQVGNGIMAARQKLKLDELNGTNKSTVNSNMSQKKLKVLKLAIKRNPFEIWFFKDRFKSEKDLLMTSLRWKNGVVQRYSSTNRLKDVILRSLNGQDVNIAIMGGSISAGGGLNLDNEDLRGIYYRVFSDWWGKTVQPVTGSVTRIHNLAIGGTSSNFFAFCYNALLNPNTEMNLALLDFTVNDYVQLRYSKFPMALPIEQLTREILSERNSPAVFYVNFVQGELNSPICNNLENHGQTMVAQNYGITTFTLRNFLCSSPSVKGKKFSRMFTSDGNHMSILGHAQMSYMIINHVRQLMLSVLDRLMTSKEVTVPKFKLPSIGDKIILPGCPLKFRGLPEPVFKSYRKNFREHPLCFTQITPDFTKNMTLRQNLPVKEIGSVGFKVMQKMFINKRGSVNTTFNQHSSVHKIQPFEIQKFRTDAYGGWESLSANSMLELEILVPLTSLSKQCLLEDSTVARNVAVAVRTHGNGGTAKVWLNEYEERGVMINTRSVFGHTKLFTIARHVIPGRNVLSVRTVTPGIFILSGVVIGPTYK